MLEWIEVIGSLVLSWPVVAFMLFLALRKNFIKLLARFIDASESKAEFGPLKIAFSQIAADSKNAVSNTNKITEIMAQSRILELEIITDVYSGTLNNRQLSLMNEHIEQLKEIIHDRE